MGSIKYHKTLNEKDILKEIDKYIEDMKTDLFLIDKVFKVCNEFIGKPINKRIETRMKKELPDYQVYLDKNYHMYNMKINKNENFHMVHSFSALLGHFDSNDFVDMEKIKEFNICYTLNTERIIKLENSKKHIKNYVLQWNNNIKGLKAINKTMEKYGLEYTFELERQ